jgi:hypothetical protein
MHSRQRHLSIFCDHIPSQAFRSAYVGSCQVYISPEGPTRRVQSFTRALYRSQSAWSPSSHPLPRQFQVVVIMCGRASRASCDPAADHLKWWQVLHPI